MIEIAQPQLTFRTTIHEEELENSALVLFEKTEPLVASFYRRNFPNTPIQIQCSIEIGSTKIVITVATAVNILVSYGSIRQSVDYLIKDAQAVTQLLTPVLSNSIGLNGEKPFRIRRGTALPGKIQRTFRAVERGQISGEEGRHKVEVALREQASTDEISDVNDLVSDYLSLEFRQAAHIAPAVDLHLDRRIPVQRALQMPKLMHVGPRRIRGVAAERDENNAIRLTLLSD